MSIASEYAARVKAASIEPTGIACAAGGGAHVTKKGTLQFLGCHEWDPAEALKLAEWIQRTFGEGT